MIIIFQQNKLLVQVKDKVINLPQAEDIINLPLEEFSQNTNHIQILAQLNPHYIPQSDSNLQLLNFKQLFNHFEHETLIKLIYAEQLVNYYITHKYCGICGNLTQIPKNKIYLVCSHCTREIYPHIAPAIIVRIHKGNSILMARGVNFPTGAWGLIAGYCEIGESLEQTAHREVMEEIGIKITNVKYWGSQYWPFPNSLMVGFTADYLDGELKIDETEISEAGFFTKTNLPGMPFTNFSIAAKMILDFENN